MTDEQASCDHRFATTHDDCTVLLAVCSACGISADDALRAVSASQETAGNGAEGREWKTLALATVDDIADELASRGSAALVLLDDPLGAPPSMRSLLRGRSSQGCGLAWWFLFSSCENRTPLSRDQVR